MTVQTHTTAPLTRADARVGDYPTETLKDAQTPTVGLWGTILGRLVRWVSLPADAEVSW